MARDRDRDGDMDARSAEEGSTARIRIVVPGPDEAEVASAEAWECGATGLSDEGRGKGAAVELMAYLPVDVAPTLRAALLLALPVVEVGASEIVVEEAWPETWKAHLKPIEVSERLVVRPSYAPFGLADGQREVVIDPGQAFGTGAHHSTRLALECLDICIAECGVRRVLDVGTGSGVLALAALSLGAEYALGFDLDPLAEPAACEAAEVNGLSASFECATGGIEDVGEGRFDLVVANLLMRELLPIVRSVSERVAPGGSLVLAGLLRRDVETVLNAFARTDRELVLALNAQRERIDDDGECWAGLILREG